MKIKFFLPFFLLLLQFNSGAQEVKLGLPLGHQSPVRSAKFSPDGKYLLSISTDKTAWIWEVKSGKLLNILTGHSERVNSANFSPDGKYIVTSSDDQTAFIWESESGKLLHKLEGHTYWVSYAVFSPDGQNILTVSRDQTAAVWESNSGKLLHILKGHNGEIISASYSPDGKYIVTASEDNTARIWENSSGRLIHLLEGHGDIVSSASFSPDNKYVVTASWDKTVRLWQCRDGHLLKVLPLHNNTITTVRFSPDGKYILTSSIDSTVRISEVQSGKPIFVLKHSQSVYDARYSPDGKNIVTSSFDGRACIWSVNDGVLLKIMDDNSSYGFVSHFNPDGRFLVTASSNGKIRITDWHDGKIIQTLEGHIHGFVNAAFSTDGKYILTTTSEHKLFNWDAGSGKPVKIPDGYSTSTMEGINSRDGKLSLALYDSIASISEIVSGRLLFKLTGHHAFVSNADFSFDGQYIFTVSEDSTVRIWDGQNGKFLHKLSIPGDWISFAGFSPDGKIIVTVSAVEHSISTWQTENGKLLQTVNGHQDYVKSVKFSPDGKYMVSASEDHTAIIWDVKNGRIIHQLDAHSDWVETAVFSPDGKYILTASDDGSFICWEAETGKMLIRTFIFENDNYVHLNPSGLFDATPGAMDLMFWVKGLDVIEFNQLKDRYWYPGLWDSVMHKGELRNVRGMDQIRLQPEVDLGNITDGKLAFTLKKRDGGYGNVAVFINGKEVSTDAREVGFDSSKAVNCLSFNLKNNPFLKPGAENRITVKAFSRDSFVAGRDEELIYLAPQEAGAGSIPSFYAVIIGINEYTNSSINLSYPLNDARSISLAMKLGAEKLFGREHTFIYTMTSPGKLLPNRQNIKKVFDSIALKAKSGDVLFIYLSGHGITLSGEKPDFYFLTNEVYTTSVSSFYDEAIRKNTTISSEELTEWIKAVPALKQVMIIDACGSGKAVDKLLINRNIDQSQLKAIDRMKDRTGMFIISGCAANSGSYESSVYGQGFLTYAILESMRGAALRNGKFIDVSMLFNYSKDRVIEMAKNAGGVQDPQLLIPKSGSFDIGILDETDRMQIPINHPKRVFNNSVMLDQETVKDELNLGRLLDDRLEEISSKGENSPFIFISGNDDPDACRISGLYIRKKGIIKLKLKISCGKNENIKNISANNIDDLIDKIINEIGVIVIIRE